MKKKLIMLMLALITIQMPSLATNWVYLCNNAYYDQETLQLSQTNARFWLKILSKNGYYTEYINLDFNNKTYIVEKFYNYNSKNEMVNYYSHNTVPKRVIPDTISEIFYKTFKGKLYTNNIPVLNNIQSTQNIDWTPYLNDLQRRIKMNWNPPINSQSLTTKMVFKIEKSGKLLSYNIIESSGSQTFDKAAISALNLTAPFRPLPANFSGTTVDIQFTFDYNIKSGSAETYSRDF